MVHFQGQKSVVKIEIETIGVLNSHISSFDIITLKKAMNDSRKILAIFYIFQMKSKKHNFVEVCFRSFGIL